MSGRVGGLNLGMEIMRSVGTEEEESSRVPEESGERREYGSRFDGDRYGDRYDRPRGDRGYGDRYHGRGSYDRRDNYRRDGDRRDRRYHESTIYVRCDY